MMVKKYNKIVAVVIVLVSFFVTGFTTGYLIPRDVHTQVIEASGEYVQYYDTIQDYLMPFNETDNVTVFIQNGIMMINHTFPNYQGMRFFNIGYREDGFFVYINQLRERT